MQNESAVRPMTAAEAIVACLKRESVKKVFCVPGESYLPVLDALHDENSIEVISARHEGAAAFMAEGYAKASLTPGIVLATRGVGGSNLSIGVHTAYQDSTPMIVFLGQVDSRFRGREGFQEVDLDRFFQHIAKWTVEISHADRVPELVGRAFRIAKSGRPGPVVISLPEDVLPKIADMCFGPVSVPPKPAPSPTEVLEAEALLSSSKKPLIIAGGGIKSAKAEQMLLQFAEKSKIPVAVAFRRHDAFPNDHPLYAGHLGLGANKEVLSAVNESDLILAIGTRLSEVTTQDYSLLRQDQKLIHIDIDFDVLGQVYPPELGIVADAAEALLALQQVEANPIWADRYGREDTAAETVSPNEMDASAVINRQVIACLAEELPDDALLTNDAGNFAGWLHAFYPFRKPHTYIGPTSGAMGYGMPAALGAKLAYPDRLVISLSGDGGFMMTAQELETAVRYEIPVISLVFNNNMYGTIRMHQEMHFPEKVIATDLGKVSFRDLALSLGADGYLADDIASFQAALGQAIENQRPALIEILTDKEHISVGATISSLRDRKK